MKIRCGFEWHVQLNTGKLFCRCRPKMHDEDGEIKLKRLFKPSFGESGRVDESAAFEGSKAKEILYDTYKDSDCLVDIDEEPPHEVDREALEIAFKFGNALKATLLDNIIFMRKTIVDGSNTSGFQRTATVGIDGEFRFKDKKIEISSISLEEDSARKAEENQQLTSYKLDRLGVPLIEVATGIIETDEEEAKEIALAFGRFTRLFNVRRGLGTIRQDVNLSIEGGRRVELKGFQNIREMDKAILNEAKRQESLIRIAKDKGYLKDNMGAAVVKEISSVLQNSSSNLIKKAISQNKEITAIKFEGFKGLFGTNITEGKRFGTEVSDYLRIKAGSGIIHSDELPNYSITQAESDRISEFLGCGKNDAFVFSIHDKGQHIAEHIIRRISDLLTLVPSEVRLVKDDNSTSFLRPLGGKDRMYIETDLPVIKVDSEIVKKASKYKGFSVDAIKEKYGLTDEYLEQLINANRLYEAIEANQKLKLGFNVIIGVMVEDRNYIRHKLGAEIKDETVYNVLKSIALDRISRDASRRVFELIALGKAGSVEEAVQKFGLKKIDLKTLEAEIRRLVEKDKLSRYDTLITNLRDRLGFSFDAKDAYEIASRLLKNG